MQRTWLWIVCASALAGATGCSNDPPPRPLAAEFTRPTDQPGALPPGPQPRPAPRPAPSGVDQARAAQDYRLVAEQVKPTGSQLPATRPAATDAPAAATAASNALQPGQFLTIGGVIAEVNGNPIYADNVLREVAPVLAARAPDLEPAAFRMFAQQEIGRQVDDMIRAEVEFAAATRNTNAEEKQIAQRMTEVWRDKTITDNMGSIEEVRRAYRAQGQSFDDALKERYRVELVRVYYTKKLLPRIQVSADDMRRYYERNKDALFTERPSATFRLIKVSAADTGSVDSAKQKADELHQRAVRGEDFATLAENNKDPVLLRTKGQIAPVDRGAFKLEAVEDAVWSVNPGEITPVVRVGDDFYVAKLESRRMGRTMEFSEDAVQRQMQETLWGEQFSRMRQEMDQQLRRESVVSRNPEMLAAMTDMAMQNYSRWRE